MQKTYQIPYTGAVKQVTDLRSGEKLAFTQTAECLTVHLPEAFAGKEGDIADCFIISVC